MKIELTEVPSKPILIQGFPSFGLIGSITTEYLLEHLKARKIGTILVEEGFPMIAVHESKIIEPVSIFYCEKYNIVIVHIVSNLQGIEWKFADCLLELAQKFEAYEVISLEGVVDPRADATTKVFYHSTEPSDKFTDIEPLKEGIIMGVGGALILKRNTQKLTSFFATTHSQLPDSHAAAEVIKVLDKYLHLEVDPAPLLERAKQFEDKAKSILSSTQESLQEKERKHISYVG